MLYFNPVRRETLHVWGLRKELCIQGIPATPLQHPHRLQTLQVRAVQPLLRSEELPPPTPENTHRWIIARYFCRWSACTDHRTCFPLCMLSGERPYCCKDCEKQFTQLNALQRHQRIHTGEKPYMCGLCCRTFTDKSTLRRHTMVSRTGTC